MNYVKAYIQNIQKDLKRPLFSVAVKRRLLGFILLCLVSFPGFITNCAVFAQAEPVTPAKDEQPLNDSPSAGVPGTSASGNTDPANPPQYSNDPDAQPQSLVEQSAGQNIGYKLQEVNEYLKGMERGSYNETYLGLQKWLDDDLIGNLFQKIGYLFGKWLIEFLDGWIAPTVHFLSLHLRTFVLNPNIALNAANVANNDDFTYYIRQLADVMYSIAMDLLLLMFILCVWKMWTEGQNRGAVNYSGTVGRMIATCGLMLLWPQLSAYIVQITNEMISAIYNYSATSSMQLEVGMTMAIKSGLVASAGALAHAVAPVVPYVGGAAVYSPVWNTIGSAASFVGVLIYTIFGMILIVELLSFIVLKAIQTGLVVAQYVFAPIFIVCFALPDAEMFCVAFVRACVEVNLWSFIWVGLLRILVILVSSDFNPWGKILTAIGILQIMLMTPMFMKAAQISPVSSFIDPSNIGGGILKGMRSIGEAGKGVLDKAMRNALTNPENPANKLSYNESYLAPELMVTRKGTPSGAAASAGTAGGNLTVGSTGAPTQLNAAGQTANNIAATPGPGPKLTAPGLANGSSVSVSGPGLALPANGTGASPNIAPGNLGTVTGGINLSTSQAPGMILPGAGAAVASQLGNIADPMMTSVPIASQNGGVANAITKGSVLDPYSPMTPNSALGKFKKKLADGDTEVEYTKNNEQGGYLGVGYKDGKPILETLRIPKGATEEQRNEYGLMGALGSHFERDAHGMAAVEKALEKDPIKPEPGWNSMAATVDGKLEWQKTARYAALRGQKMSKIVNEGVAQHMAGKQDGNEYCQYLTSRFGNYAEYAPPLIESMTDIENPISPNFAGKDEAVKQLSRFGMPWSPAAMGAVSNKSVNRMPMGARQSTARAIVQVAKSVEAQCQQSGMAKADIDRYVANYAANLSQNDVQTLAGLTEGGMNNVSIDIVEEIRNLSNDHFVDSRQMMGNIKKVHQFTNGMQASYTPNSVRESVNVIRSMRNHGFVGANTFTQTPNVVRLVSEFSNNPQAIAEIKSNLKDIAQSTDFDSLVAHFRSKHAQP